MTAARARALYAAGLQDAEDLAASDQARIERALAKVVPQALRAARRRPGQQEDPKQAAGRGGGNGIVRRAAKALVAGGYCFACLPTKKCSSERALLSLRAATYSNQPQLLEKQHGDSKPRKEVKVEVDVG